MPLPHPPSPFVDKTPCKTCGKSVIFKGAEYCNYWCWDKAMALKAAKEAAEVNVTWINVRREDESNDE